MTRDEFYILNSIYNGSVGRASTKTDVGLINALRDKDIYINLCKCGFISSTGKITERGLDALEPFRVRNAVILAAGASTRFIPLSLEMPKGLFEVKGEPLIERQICQLKEAGIDDITIVLGYKKEMFFYLKEKYGVNFVINTTFNVKNNIESIFLARERFANTYLCVSDSYFVENPFNQYEYESFSAGVHVWETKDEIYADIDENNKISRIFSGKNEGIILFGYAYWTESFSSEFIRIAEREHDTGKYDRLFWEWLVADNLYELPPFFFKEYSDGEIFEFDYFEELRKFDAEYLDYTHSNIIRNIKLVFRCDEDEITEFRNVSEGLTNTSFVFNINGKDYIYRHPGDGTGSIINRKNEKYSLIKAKEIGADPTYFYMDLNEGWKISEFVHEFREPDYSSFEDSKRILRVLKYVHNSGIVTDYGLKPWEDAEEMVKLLEKKQPGCFQEYLELKEKVLRLYTMTLNDGVKKCFCHGDTYKHNWMLKENGEVYLIDWEYAGYSDPGIDVGYYIVDAMYDFKKAEEFIKEYLGRDYSEERCFHFMAYTAIIAYYWFVWALYRESCGAVIGEAKDNWRMMANKYCDYCLIT